MKEQKKISLATFVLILMILVLLCCLIIFIISTQDNKKQEENKVVNEAISDVENNTSSDIINDNDEENKITNNKTGDYISEFDISFLKLENEKVNKIYSPLSIKYALKMLEEGATGESKMQISKIIGNSGITKYNSSSNLSLANALFVRDTFEKSIKDEYKDTLQEKYDAEVIVDSFANADTVNTWVSNKTLNLINNMLESIGEDKNFLLVNALGIDMEWANKFLKQGGVECYYEHENFWWHTAEQVTSFKFGEDEQLVSGMEIIASINNYNIVDELGKENIKKTVGEEFKKWAKNLNENDYEYNDIFNGDLSEENIELKLEQYLEGGKYYSDYESKGYISELDSNYKRVDKSTDFSLYVDDNVKAFAKDLKEYNGTTLQYIGIMPVNKELDDFVKNADEKEINTIISNLKELITENFKDGVVTKITGYIPKFKFEYDLKLKEDLAKIGITDVFEEGKANLTELSDEENIYISDAVHKANIEFTQDGIKAAAATMFGGAGAGDSFDYIYEVPVEEIDLTFDKPYMFIIRDKETGEIWFTGTVYEPLLWENEPEKDNAGRY